VGNCSIVDVEQRVGLTIEQIAAGTPRISSPYRNAKWLMRAILASEVAAGRVIEHHGQYALNREVWERDQLDALRELR
jgi:hypothetical protein